MAKFLFWNLNRRPLEELLSSLARERAIDVIVLAECEISSARLLGRINEGQERQFSLPTNLSRYLTFLVRYPRECLTMLHDSPGVAVRLLRPPIGLDILLIAVHLQSRLFQDRSEQVFECTRIASVIADAERKVGHSRTVVLGDFNMDPFDDGVVAGDGLHAVMDRKIALRGRRTVRGEAREFFYNPMWGQLGDRGDGPPGTYFYDSGTQVNLFWHTFDQVLLRPGLLEYFVDDSLKVVSYAGKKPLLSSDGRPSVSLGSDHLPITFELAVEKG